MSPSDARSRERKLPVALLWFLGTLIVLWTLSVGQAAVRSLQLHSWSGFQWMYLSYPGFDFYDYIDRVRYIHRPEFFAAPGYRWYYPAPGVFVYWSYYKLHLGSSTWRLSYLFYGLSVAAGLLVAGFGLSAALERRGISQRTSRNFVFGSVVLAWPVFFALQRGNIEAVIWFWFAAAICALALNRWLLSGVLMGVAAAFKIYPSLGFALFLRQRRWKELIAGVATMIVITLAALRFLAPNLRYATRETLAGVQAWTTDYAGSYSPAATCIDHSLFELVKIVLHTHRHPPYVALMHVYMLVAGVAALIVFFARVIRLPRANQLLFLVVASLILPPASFDYTLVSLYIPWAWIVLVEASRPLERQGSPVVRIIMVLFAVAMAPDTFLLVGGIPISGAIKGVCLLALLSIAAIWPLAGNAEIFEENHQQPSPAPRAV